MGDTRSKDTKVPKKNDDDVDALLAHHAARFLEKVGARPTHTQPDRDAVASLLKLHKPEVVRRALDAMFDNGDDYTVKRGYSMSLFAKQFDRYVAQASTQRPAPTPYVDPFHDPPCRDYGECSQRRREEGEAEHQARLAAGGAQA